MSDITRASIVINNYNYGRFLADAIESALAQTYRNTEVIVVDDGSTDDSREVIRRYGNRIKAVLKANGGQASTYNAGVASARGDIVCFLDADDALFETAISEALPAFQDPQTLKAEWQLKMVDALGRHAGGVVPKKPLPPGDLRELTISNGPFYDWLMTPPSSGNCYARSMLRRVLPVPEAPFRHGADVYLTMLAPIFGRIQRLSQPQGMYRVHETNNYFGRPLDSNRLCDYIQRFENCCLQLQSFLRTQGVEVELDVWKERNINYLWPTRLLQAKSDIESVLSPGDSYVLVNDNEWGNGEPVEGRHAIPFLEHDGEYWGPPRDDDTAISELIRLQREKDVAHIVISWTAYWWLDYYDKFHDWLRSKCKCILENERLIVFQIRETETLNSAKSEVGECCPFA